MRESRAAYDAAHFNVLGSMARIDDTFDVSGEHLCVPSGLAHRKRPRRQLSFREQGIALPEGFD
jgi:hypothetical protein